MTFRAPTLALAALISLASPVLANTVHALLMGFDKYENKVSLLGSRNDALDIATVLRKRGVGDVTLVNEANGTRAQIVSAWTAMVGRAAVGDLIIVSFSGHGNKSPERSRPNHRPDGMDKGFLLPLYDEDKHPEEQLRDEDLYDLFKVASDKGLKVMFVADACHSGAGVRGVPPLGAEPRFQRFNTHGNPLPPPPTTVVRRPPIAGLTIYSAADENQTIQEFTLSDRRRGALSYVVARGLEGAAAADGALTDGSLARYVITNVRLQSNNTQIPSAVTPEPDFQIFSGATKAVQVTGMPELKPIAFFSEAEATIDPATIDRVASKPLAELSWSARGDVTNGHGDVIAHGIGPDLVQNAIDTRRVFNALSLLVGQDGKALDTGVAATGKPALDRFYGPGEKIKISAEKSDLKFLTVIDLNADGTVQFLWPQKNDPREWRNAEAPNFEVKVTPPFGSDTVIFIESDQVMSGLHAQLASLDSKQAATGLYDALRIWLPRVKSRQGLQPVFTCAVVLGDGSCQ